MLNRNDIADLRELGQSASHRNETRRVLVEGYRAISGAQRSGAHFEQLLTTDPQDERLASIDAEKIVIDEKSLARIATTTSPQHTIAICTLPITPLEEFIDGIIAIQPIFVLDNVSDPGNVGTIIRSSVAFGIGGMITVGGCDPFHPKVVRSSAGTIFACPIISLDEFQLEKTLAHRDVYAADLGSNSILSDVTFPDNAAIVLGSEAHGIITPYFHNNTHSFTIPMAELCESLNVAMSATIVAHHIAAGKTH